MKDEISEKLLFINTIQDVLNYYGYRFQILKVYSVGFFMSILYGLYLTIYSVINIPIDEYYSLSSFDCKISSSLIFFGLALGSIIQSMHEGLRKNRRALLIIINFTILLVHVIMALVINNVVFSITRFVI